MTPITVEHLWPLALLLGLPIVIWLARHSDPSLDRRRVRAAGGLRVAAAGLVVLALMRPSLIFHTQDIAVVYAIDLSRSVAPDAIASSFAWAEAATAASRPSQTRFVVFAERARLVDTLEEARTIALAEADGSIGDRTVGRDGTNLETALVTALSAFPRGHVQRLVLSSDGHATDGDTEGVLAAMQARGVRMLTVPAATATGAHAWIEDIAVPRGARAGSEIPVAVSIGAVASETGRLEVSVDGRRAFTEARAVARGAQSVTVPLRLVDPGARVIQARWLANGTSAGSGTHVTAWLAEPVRALIVARSRDAAAALAAALRVQGMRVDVTSPSVLASNPARIDRADVVLLDDPTAQDHHPPTAARLERFVRDGGGLVHIAGEGSHGEAGLSGSALERLLPVTFEGRRRRRDIDLVVLIDRSYSMRGAALTAAKTAALAAMDALTDPHRVAVVAFDARQHVVVPLKRGVDRAAAEEAVSRLIAGGQTNVHDALWHAYGMLKGDPKRSRHVILLSDGNTAPSGNRPPEAGVALAGVVEDSPSTLTELGTRFRKAGITVSTVAFGDDADSELLGRIADWTGGRHYATTVAEEIPALFVEEARRLQGDSLVEREFHPVVRTASIVTDGLDFAGGPPLRGFAVARARSVSEVLLESTKGRPLLVAGRHGLGHTAAFLSDANGRWAAGWLDWSGYARFWGRLVRAMARDADAGATLDLRVTGRGRQAVVTLEALNDAARLRVDLAPRIRMSSTDGSVREVPLVQEAPGRYRVTVPLTGWEHAHRFALAAGGGVDAAEALRAGVRDLHGPHGRERPAVGPDEVYLRELAERTGGRHAPSPTDVFADLGDRARRVVPLWQGCVIVALLLFLGDLAVRRFPGRARRASASTRDGH